MGAEEIKKICDFLASLPIDAVTSAYLIDPLTNEVVQQGFAAHDIGDKVVTDQDILNYRAGVGIYQTLLLNTPSYIWSNS